jgi:hypothetical protein
LEIVRGNTSGTPLRTFDVIRPKAEIFLMTLHEMGAVRDRAETHRRKTVLSTVDVKDNLARRLVSTCHQSSLVLTVCKSEKVDPIFGCLEFLEKDGKGAAASWKTKEKVIAHSGKTRQSFFWVDAVHQPNWNVHDYFSDRITSLSIPRPLCWSFIEWTS